MAEFAMQLLQWAVVMGSDNNAVALAKNNWLVQVDVADTDPRALRLRPSACAEQPLSPLPGLTSRHGVLGRAVHRLKGRPTGSDDSSGKQG